VGTKNILVSKNYTVADHSKWYENRQHEHDLADNYTAMEQLMVSSAQQHVNGLSDIVIHRGNAENIREVFREHFFEIYELWKTGCNILYVDLDVLFLKPYSVFGEHDRFMMFNYTSPKHTKDTHYNITIQHYFNCGVRYYPSTMPQSCWQVGIDMINNWNPKRWDSEQVIYNQMMWSQNIDVSTALKPALAYQYINDTEASNNRFNQLELSEACAVHFHGTRNSKKRLAKMRELCNEPN
jgi:hypothetical protein